MRNKKACSYFITLVVIVSRMTTLIFDYPTSSCYLISIEMLTNIFVLKISHNAIFPQLSRGVCSFTVNLAKSRLPQTINLRK